ncbi:MAG: cardiolipin synthase [Marinilabiliaceae bacterium]|nr:cardiolipin synthase [Marinilabiliaceae bacterium]
MIDFLNHLHSYVTPFMLTVYAIIILVVVIVIVLENRSPLKTLSWIMVLLLLPGLGFVFYVFFGQNFRKEKIIARKGLKNHERLLSLANAQINKMSEGNLLDNTAANHKRNIVQLLLNNSYSLITIGNKVTVFHNGADKFEALLNAMGNAKKFIHLEYYIFEEDEVGNRIKRLLIQKAAQGVEVRLIVDDVGSWELKDKFFKEMEDAGIETGSFLKVRFPWLTSKVNYRNHRKIVVIDGEVGFMGGINVADRYLDGHESYGIWRDTHMMIEGDAVNSLQTTFLIDWYFVKQVELAHPHYFPSKTPVGDKIVQIVSSGPDSDWPAIMMGIFQAIATARDYVYISTPYFMPNDHVLMAIKTAALGGVDVHLLIPSKSDAYVTLLSSRSYLRDLMESGVKVSFYDKGFLHCKTIVVDDVLSLIGSANMDFRSFEQNFEVTSFIYDEEVAIEMRNVFLNDLNDSTRIYPEVWVRRPLNEKAKESFARLLSPLL